MEDMLEVYRRPYDAQRPVLCVDEKLVQLIQETRPALPPSPGQPVRYDYEYRRAGTANLFLTFEPLLGWRGLQVTARRTALDFAEVLRWLAEDLYPDVERLVLVVDNLNTHTPAVLYQAFPPEQARRIAARLEWHYTPKHGSWLNLAEVEFSALERQCLRRRLGSREELEQQTAPWCDARNDKGIEACWRFTTADARIKLAHLYPSIQ